MGFFQDLFGDTAADAAKQAAATRVAGIQKGVTEQQPYFTTAKEALDTGYGSAAATLAPLYDTGVGGLGLYSDLTGVNGVAGQDRARQLFNTDPGYQFTMNQALQSGERLASKYGQTNSGNEAIALQDRAAGLASQQYKDWASRIGQYLPYSLTAGQLASANQQQQGVNTAGLNLNQGNFVYNADTGQANATAQGITDAAAAQTAGAGNVAKLGTQLLGFALAPFTGGASAALGSVGNLFMGGGSPSGYGTAPSNVGPVQGYRY